MVMEDLQNRGVARFRHLVFDYQPSIRAAQNDSPKERVEKCLRPNDEPADHEAAQPLSWHLTANQEDGIQESFFRVSACSMRATDWAKNYLSKNANPSWPQSPEVECNLAMSKPIVCPTLNRAQP
jgi:hypothetical protein